MADRYRVMSFGFVDLALRLIQMPLPFLEECHEVISGYVEEVKNLLAPQLPRGSNHP